MTKAQYEQRLGPLLTLAVAPALHAVVGNRGLAIPAKVTAAIALVRVAHDEMAALTPPAEVADLHKKALAVMASMITHMTKLRDAENRSEKSAAASAATALITDGRHLETLGTQFTSRGY